MSVNYRKGILTGLPDDRLKEIVDELSAHVGIRIIQETDMDHIHMLFSPGDRWPPPGSSILLSQ
jgi:REP element-mobilizing transposase RayT